MAFASAHPPGPIPVNVFLAISWGCTALSFLFLVFRIFIRFQTFRKLFWDDACVVFAWCLSILTAIYWSFTYETMYRGVAASKHNQRSSPANPGVHRLERRGRMVVIVLFLTSLWLVKISFLIFFRRLFHKDIKILRTQWWIVSSITILSFFAVFAANMYWYFTRTGGHHRKCSTNGFLGKCSAKKHTKISWQIIIMDCVFDLGTDCMIMSIPFAILWQAKSVPWPKRLGLTGLFSLALVTMVVAILRITLISTRTGMDDVTWRYIWSTAEQNVAIIVGCLGSFRTLYVVTRRRKCSMHSPYFLPDSQTSNRTLPRHPLEEKVHLRDGSHYGRDSEISVMEITEIRPLR